MINHNHMEEVRKRYGEDYEKLRVLSCIEEEGEKKVNMAHLAIIGRGRGEEGEHGTPGHHWVSRRQWSCIHAL